VADAVAVGGATPKTDPATGLSSSQPQMRASVIWPDDDNKFEVIMGRPCFWGPKSISLPEALDMT
jgi:hypothetical protein